MSRSESRFSPMQRKACLVLALCFLALAASIAIAVILPSHLGFLTSSDAYDASLYPVDTTLGAVLGESAADADYVTDTVFIGDEYTVSLVQDSSISLNQYVGQAGLKTDEVLKTACVYFSGDSAAYTIPQAIAKMKPRRVIITIGSNDVDGSMAVESFIQNYKQMLQSISAAYPYCDVIANCIPPVVKGGEGADQQQLLIDQFNQAIAAACEDMGDYKFLNSADALKDDTGYAESEYFSGNGFSSAGVSAFLIYVRNHAYVTEDTRPDTNDIPQRVESPSGTDTATPTATPKMYKATYSVADSSQGSLTGNGQVNAAAITLEVGERETASVTAVAADGFIFDRWSDGQTSETRYDIVTQDITVTAQFKDARVAVSLDKGDTAMKVGDSLVINVSVKLGNADYDNSNVQWSVNDELEMNGGSFTFTPSEAGTYVIKAGIEINGTFQLAQLTATVEGAATSMSVSGVSPITVGGSTTLTADVQNQSGDVTWSCDETSWTATGNQVTFTANQEGTYTLHAQNNGAQATFVLTVTAAPTPAPTIAPTPTPAPTAEPASEQTDSETSDTD